MPRNIPNRTSLLNSLYSTGDVITRHLIKIQSPLSSQVQKSYSYISDALIPVTYGGNIYYPRYVQKVGDVSESISIQNSNMSLSLDATTVRTPNVLFQDATVTEDYIEFAYTDKELITASIISGIRISLVGGRNDTRIVSINYLEFLANSTARIHFNNLSNVAILPETIDLLEVSLSQPEIDALLIDRGTQISPSYINKEIEIYRQYLNKEGTVLSTMVYFKGFISGGKFSDSASKATMTWTCSSNWADFLTIGGRKGTDSSHREESSQKLLSSTEYTKAAEYSDDLGFMHSESAVNVLADFTSFATTASERTYRGFRGRSSRTKVSVSMSTSSRDQELSFNLNPQYIPVVYGVNIVEPNPVFADVLSATSDFTCMLTAQTLCEGPIAGVLDIYDEENPSVCLDQRDGSIRGDEDKTNPLTCTGRADAGDHINAFSLQGFPDEAAALTTTVSNSSTITLKQFPTGMILSYTSKSDLANEETPVYVTLGLGDYTIAEKVKWSNVIDPINYPLPENKRVSLLLPDGRSFKALAEGDSADLVLTWPLSTGGGPHAFIDDYQVDFEGNPSPLSVISHTGTEIVVSRPVTLAEDTILTFKGVSRYSQISLAYANATVVRDFAGGHALEPLLGIERLVAPQDFTLGSMYFGNDTCTGFYTKQDAYYLKTGRARQAASPVLEKVGTSINVTGSPENPFTEQVLETDAQGAAILRKGWSFRITTATGTIDGDPADEYLGKPTFRVLSDPIPGTEYLNGTASSYYIKVGKNLLVRELLKARDITRAGTLKGIDQLYPGILNADSYQKKQTRSRKSGGLPYTLLTGAYGVLTYQSAAAFSTLYKFYSSPELVPFADTDVSASVSVTAEASQYAASTASTARLRALANPRSVVSFNLLSSTGTTTLAGFKIQDLLFKESTVPYWGSSHTLNDTAYLTSISKLNADREEYEKPTCVVQGKFIDCYNYDNSYPVAASSNFQAFKLGQTVSLEGRTNETRNFLALTSKRLSNTQTLTLAAIPKENNKIAISVSITDLAPVSGTYGEGWPRATSYGTEFYLTTDIHQYSTKNNSPGLFEDRYTIEAYDLKDMLWDGEYLYILSSTGVSSFLPPNDEGLLSLLEVERSESQLGTYTYSNENVSYAVDESGVPAWGLVNHQDIRGPAGNTANLVEYPATLNTTRVPVSGTCLAEGQVEVATFTLDTKTSASVWELDSYPRGVLVGDFIYTASGSYLGKVIQNRATQVENWNVEYGADGSRYVSSASNTIVVDDYSRYNAEAGTSAAGIAASVSAGAVLTFKRPTIEVFAPSTLIAPVARASAYRTFTPSADAISRKIDARTPSKIYIYEKHKLSNVYSQDLYPSVDSQAIKARTPTLDTSLSDAAQQNVYGAADTPESIYGYNREYQHPLYGTHGESGTYMFTQGAYGCQMALAGITEVGQYPYGSVSGENRPWDYTDILPSIQTIGNFATYGLQNTGDTWSAPYHPPLRVISQAENPSLPDRCTAMSTLLDAASGNVKRHFVQDIEHNTYEGNKLPRGMTSDGVTIWVADWVSPPSLLPANYMESQARYVSELGEVVQLTEGITGFVGYGSGSGGGGIFSGGGGFTINIPATYYTKPIADAVWSPNACGVTTHSQLYGTGKIYAYNVSDLGRDPSKDILPYLNCGVHGTEVTKTVTHISNYWPRVPEGDNTETDSDSIYYSGRPKPDLDGYAGYHAGTYGEAYCSEIVVGDNSNIEVGDILVFAASDKTSYVRPSTISRGFDPSFWTPQIRPSMASISTWRETLAAASGATSALTTPGATIPQASAELQATRDPILYDTFNYITLDHYASWINGIDNYQIKDTRIGQAAQYRHAFIDEQVEAVKVSQVCSNGTSVFVNRYVDMDLSQNTTVVFKKDYSHILNNHREGLYPESWAKLSLDVGGTNKAYYMRDPSGTRVSTTGPAWHKGLRTTVPQPFDVHVQGTSGSVDQILYILNSPEATVSNFSASSTLTPLNSPEYNYTVPFNVSSKKPYAKTIWMPTGTTAIAGDASFLYSGSKNYTDSTLLSYPQDLADATKNPVQAGDYYITSYDLTGTGDGTNFAPGNPFVGSSEVPGQGSGLGTDSVRHYNYLHFAGTVTAGADTWGQSVSCLGQVQDLTGTYYYNSIVPTDWSTTIVADGITYPSFLVFPFYSTAVAITSTARVPSPVYKDIDRPSGRSATYNLYNLAACKNPLTSHSLMLVEGCYKPTYTFDSAEGILSVSQVNNAQLTYTASANEDHLLFSGLMSSTSLTQFNSFGINATWDPSAPLGLGAFNASGNSYLVEEGETTDNIARYNKARDVIVPKALGNEPVTIKAFNTNTYTAADSNSLALLGTAGGWESYNFRPTTTASVWNSTDIATLEQYYSTFAATSSALVTSVTDISKRRNLEGELESVLSFADSLENFASRVVTATEAVSGETATIKTNYPYPTEVDTNSFNSEDPSGPTATFPYIASGVSTGVTVVGGVLGDANALALGVVIDDLDALSFTRYDAYTININTEGTFSSSFANFTTALALKAQAADFETATLSLSVGGTATTFYVLPAAGFVTKDLFASGLAFVWLQGSSLTFFAPCNCLAIQNIPSFRTLFLNNSDPTATGSITLPSMCRFETTYRPEVDSDSFLAVTLGTGQTALGSILEYDTTTGYSIVSDIPQAELDQFGNFIKYRFVSKEGIKDLRVSTNPAWQLLDYLTNPVYGRGLSIDNDIDFESFNAAAKYCDAKSTVTIAVPSGDMLGAPPTPRSVYSVFAPVSGELIFKGTVSETSSVQYDNVEYLEVSFIDVIGKLGRRYNGWQKISPNWVWTPSGQLSWADNTKTAGTAYGDFTDADISTERAPFFIKDSGEGVQDFVPDMGEESYTITIIGRGAQTFHEWEVSPEDLTKLQQFDAARSNSLGRGAGSTLGYVRVGSINAVTSTFITSINDPAWTAGQVLTFRRFRSLEGSKLSSDGNPLVKKLRSSLKGFSDSGYSLYDADGVKYWRYVGWEDLSQSYVTRHQTNHYIDTSKSIFENVKSMLAHFNAVLNYSNGRYSLAVKTRQGKVWEGERPEYDKRPEYTIRLSPQNYTNSDYVDFDIRYLPSINLKKGYAIRFPSGEERYIDRVETLKTVPLYVPVGAYAIEQELLGLGALGWDTDDFPSEGPGFRVYLQKPISLDATALGSELSCSIYPLSRYSDITEDDIIGPVTISSPGAKGSYNGIKATILDPQAKFGGRDVSFYNSDYLATDNNVAKAGTYSAPGVTNYFNARLNVKQSLDVSRFGAVVSFIGAPYLIDTVPGDIITLSFPEYGWTRKLFRVEKISLKENGQVGFSVKEHEDKTYILTGEGTVATDSIVRTELSTTENPLTQ